MSTTAFISNVVHSGRDRTYWMTLYTTAVSALGLLVAINALIRFDDDWMTLAILVIAAMLSELTSVRLFRSSHGQISIVTVTIIAAIALLGPWGGALTALASGFMTIVTTSAWFLGVNRAQMRVRWWQRTTFNMSMRVLAVTSAGVVFLWSGGTPGALLSWWLFPTLLITVIVDEFVAAFLLVMVIHLQTGRPFFAIWRQDWLWSYPIIIASGVIGGGGLAIVYEIAGSIGLGVFVLPIFATGYAIHLYVGHTRTYVDQLEVANQTLEEANLGLLQTLAAVVDAYDIYTFGHSAQVARYAKAIAKEMNLSKEEQIKIYHGGFIHDIGKVGVTDAIIGKRGRLTDEEYAALKLHTVIGADIVRQMPQFQDLVPLVRSHHERWDGRGYPDGLKGAENSLGARIMCVADSVEAMLSDRPYQATRTLAAVVEEVARCSGTQFDPEVVKAFMAVVKNYGDEFFINSASSVAHKLEETGVLDTLDGLCYVKKSMISHQMRQSAIEILDKSN